MMWRGACKEIGQDRQTHPAHSPSAAHVPHMQFSGSLLVPATEMYTFYLSSDDGSRLWLDGKLVIDHDGPVSAQNASRLYTARLSFAAAVAACIPLTQH